MSPSNWCGYLSLAITSFCNIDGTLLILSPSLPLSHYWTWSDAYRSLSLSPSLSLLDMIGCIVETKGAQDCLSPLDKPWSKIMCQNQTHKWKLEMVDREAWCLKVPLSLHKQPTIQNMNQINIPVSVSWRVSAFNHCGQLNMNKILQLWLQNY